jgi:flagellar basal body P-ring formation protein FlgA
MTRLVLLVWALMLCWPAFGDGVRIPVPSHDIARGAVLEASDLTWRSVSASVPPGTVLSTEDVIGLETRRVLRAGESLRAQDFHAPILVTKGTSVTMVYDVPGVSLSATVRVISSGGMGETITVQNPVSFRQVGAVVIGPGLVRALNNGDGIARNASR